MANGRDSKGRFLKGRPGGPGRPPKEESLTEALRMKVNKQAIADKLIEIALEKEDLAALRYIYDRIDGTPRQTIDQNVRQVPDVVGYEPDDFTRSADSEDPDADTE